MQSFNTITKKINTAPDLSFGDIINDAIELFKKVWIKGFLTILIIAVAAIAVSFIFQLIGLAPDSLYFVDNGFNLETLVGFYSQNAIYSIPQTIMVSALTIALMAAFYRICKQVSLGQNVNDDYFYFFKKEYFTKALMLGMIYTAIATIAQLLLLIPYIYAIVPLSYFSIIFSNNPHLREIEIVKLSFAIGNKKWLISFGSLFVCSILGMLGIIACGIGVLLTISIAYLPFFLIYKDVIGFDEQSEIDLIGEDNGFN
ncbi:hypothetical protein E1J38_006085 [Seonamhaeicola sediminis]|uniref:Beta-carotene 15,15'-monooxygenase n=1 Tax=Seonamhaeicola sediminis TaxID=2528206 RepID=A0A562YGH2_9FLAO|nr:hypothetical protein [Seonamhaeicola sediminis]TWO33461.1 hypothetical protein E1J38_006085 [Seonamhaeicola sediminis]